MRLAHFFPIAGLAAALTAPLAAQSTLAWTEDVSVLQASPPFHQGPFALDDGGAIFVSRLEDPGPGMQPLEVTRFDRDGRETWTTEIDPSSGLALTGSGFASAAATGDGTTVVVAKTTNAVFAVVQIAPSGAINWSTEVTVPQAFSSADLFELALAADGGLALCIAARQPIPGSPFQFRRTLITSIDSAGVPLWNVDLQGPPAGIGLTPAGEVFALTGQSTASLVRIDAGGTVVASAASQPAGLLSSLTYDPRTGGTLHIERLGTGAGNGTLVATDSALSELWRAPLAGVEALSIGAAIEVDSSTGLSLVAGGTGGSAGFAALQAHDASGNLVFETIDQGIQNAFLSPTVVPDVGVAVIDLVSGPVIRTFDFGGNLLDVILVPGLFSIDVGPDGRLFAASFEDLSPVTSVSVDQYIRGSAGSSYCDQLPNSDGQPGRLRALGSEVAAENRITLAADRLPTGVFSLFVTGTAPALIPGIGGGLGTLCVGGQLGRLNGPSQIGLSSAQGLRSLELDLAALPGPVGTLPAMAGESRYFQLWHRDPFLPGGSQLTNAVRVQLR